MDDKWDYLFGKAADQLRPFNDKLIYDFRKQKIDKIPEYLDKIFHQIVAFFGFQLDYAGYRTLTPEEHIEYLVSNQLTKGSVQIRNTETSLVAFELRFEGKSYYVYIDIPYLINERVVYNDTEYYPQFPIVEKGGINRTDHGTIIVKVMRVPITFGRRTTNKYKMISVSGTLYPELLITVKIHQGAASTEKSESTPLVLYHFCKLGYAEAMRKYGMDPDDIRISHTFDTKDPEWEFFSLPDKQRYMQVRRSALSDCYKRRMVLSLYRMFMEIPEFRDSDVFGKDPSYYKAVLGKFIGSRDDNQNKLLIPNANKHLAMTDPMLDKVAQEQLRSVNCNCEDIYDLLYWMYFNIDDQLVSYDPTNLYDKKVEGLDDLAYCPARNIVKTQYNIINSKKAILDERTVEQFCKRASQRPSWIKAGDTIFRPNPVLYNDNWLAQMGLKRFLSLEPIASSFSKRKKTSSKTTTSPELLKAHYSQLTVTALLTIPASSPVKTGDMNPWAEIEMDSGNIIRPKYADEIVHVYD